MVGVRDNADGQLAGQFTDRVCAHAVCDQENVAADLPLFVIAGEERRVRVLVVPAANTYVGQTGVFNRVVPDHQQSPQAAFFPTFYVCYNPAGQLQSGRNWRAVA
jgi:hypothetical protein